MAIAHHQIEAREHVEHVVAQTADRHVWERPGGAASIGFHLRHLGGALDRLFTYARGETLSAEQRAAFKVEEAPGDPPASLLDIAQGVGAQIERAFEQLRATSPADLTADRRVGRAGLPS